MSTHTVCALAHVFMLYFTTAITDKRTMDITLAELNARSVDDEDIFASAAQICKRLASPDVPCQETSCIYYDADGEPACVYLSHHVRRDDNGNCILKNNGEEDIVYDGIPVCLVRLATFQAYTIYLHFIAALSQAFHTQHAAAHGCRPEAAAQD